MKKENIVVTMIRECGNDYGFTYTLSNKDADFVEGVIKDLMKYCESRKIAKENEQCKG